MQHGAWFLGLAVALAGCPNTAVTSASVECDYGGQRLHGDFDARTPDQCIYRREPGTLYVRMVGVGSVVVQVAGFHGEGVYTTGPEQDTSVFIQTVWPDGAAAAGDIESYRRDAGDPSHPCTLTVTDTDLLDVSIPEGGVAHGRVQLLVSCPRLGGAATEPYECVLTPGTFDVLVPECEASES